MAVLHASATILVIVITANHWWLDGIVAGTFLAASLAVLPRPAKTRLPSLGRGRSLPVQPRNTEATP